MKLKFKDGTIIEVSDCKNKSQEEIIKEAKKVYKEFKDSQVNDSVASDLLNKMVQAENKMFEEEKKEYEEDPEYFGSNLEDAIVRCEKYVNYLSNNVNENIKLFNLIDEMIMAIDCAFVLYSRGGEINDFINKVANILNEKCPNKINILNEEFTIKEILNLGFDRSAEHRSLSSFKDSKPIRRNKKFDCKDSKIEDKSGHIEGRYIPATRYEPAEYPEFIVESDYSRNEVYDDYIYSVDYKENFGTFDEIIKNEFEEVTDTDEKINAFRELDLDPEEEYKIYKCINYVTDNNEEDYDKGHYFTEDDIIELFSYDLTKIQEEMYEEWENYEPDYEDYEY